MWSQISPCETLLEFEKPIHQFSLNNISLCDKEKQKKQTIVEGEDPNLAPCFAFLILSWRGRRKREREGGYADI